MICAMDCNTWPNNWKSLPFWVDNEVRQVGVGLWNADEADRPLQRLGWDGRRGTEVPGHACSGTSKLVCDSLWYVQPMELIVCHGVSVVKPWSNFCVLLTHAGGSIEHSLQLWRPCVDCIAAVNSRSVTSRKHARVFPLIHCQILRKFDAINYIHTCT